MLRAIIPFLALINCGSALAEVSYGYFCSAAGQGVWAGRTQSLRWQTSLVPMNVTESRPEAILYANEEPAARFPLTFLGGNHWTGFSTMNRNVRVDAYLVPGGQARFILNDWRNFNASSLGSCDPYVRPGI